MTVAKSSWKSWVNFDAPWFRYAAAAGATLLAVGIRVALSPVLGDKAPFGLLLLAILFSAATGGYGPAALSMALGALSVIYRLAVDGSSDAIPPNDIVGAVFFVIVGGSIAAVAGRLREAQQSAQATLVELSRQRQRATDIGLRLEAALDAGATATWTWDIPTNRVIGDKNLARLFAMKQDETQEAQMERSSRPSTSKIGSEFWRPPCGHWNRWASSKSTSASFSPTARSAGWSRAGGSSATRGGKPGGWRGCWSTLPPASWLKKPCGKARNGCGC